MIFVFGSNTAGVHGAGAAYDARVSYGAEPGHGFGHMGRSFAIPTKDSNIRTLPLEKIRPYVEAFKTYAAARPDLQFKVTRIGCRLAGYTDAQIAPMFEDSPSNCYFDEKWAPYLGEQFNYWGTA